MSMLRVTIAGLLTFFAAAHTFAASSAISMSRDSMLTSREMGRLGIGANVEDFERKLDLENDTTPEIHTRSYSAQVEVDICRWFSLFTTLGASLIEDEEGHFNDEDFKWSVGFHWNVWSYVLERPWYMDGRISLQLFGEFAQYRGTWADEEIRWDDIAICMPLTYEISERISSDPDDVCSLLFYIGPSVSLLDGSIDAERHGDFNEEQAFGVVGGLQVFLARNLSFGVQAQSYNEAGFSANMRYHF